ASAAAEAGAPPPITGEADRAGTAASGDGGSHAAAPAGASEDLRARLDERFAARLGGQAAWRALVLLDGAGSVLAAAGSPALVQRLAGRGDLARAAARKTVLALPGDEGLVMAVPCASGDGPEGILAGVLDAGRVLAAAPRGEDARTLHLVADGRSVAGKPAAWLAPLLADGALPADAETDADDGRRRAVRAAVGGSGLAVLLSLPGETSAAPSGIAGLVAGPVWRLPALLAALAALVLLPLPALAGARRRARDLAGRAREAERAQHDAQKKSEQLMAEVSALKKAEARQRVSEEHLRNFINALPLPVFEVDAQGRVRYVNTSAYATFGYEQEDVEKGLAIGTVIAEEEGERLTEEFAQALAGGEGEEFAHEFTARTKEGRQFPVLISSTPVFHEKQAVGLRGIVVDMSARARAEEALRRAKEDAESASRTKGEFLANVSHEIRTPLNGILGMTELALDTELSSQQREYLRLVKQSGESLLGIINDILDFSKIEAGKLSIDQSEFSLSDCLGGILKTLGVRADDKGLELLAQVPVSVPDALLGDCGRLRQVLVNLVGNAIKFTSEGEILVRAEVEAETDEDLRLHFLVRDTGIGIQPEKQDSIFRAFEQADGSTTRRHGGTGLGLAISSHLVSLMGGRLWVDSEVGVGSTFHFSASFGKIGLGLDRDEERLPQLRGLPLLVVDDNATSRQILAETLGGLGLKVDAVASGAEALAKLTSEKEKWLDARLVLVDSDMPGMSGFDLAKRLLEDITLRAIPVLMLASAGRRRDAIRCHELDLPAYLTKPALPLDLLDVLFTALGELPVIKDGASGLASLQGQRSAKARRALRVLLVEDNLVNQRLAARLLEKWGHSVGVAENGEEALAALEREPWDLALMDVQMPKMDGYETTAAIRKREAATGEHLPVIALTAHAMQGDRERCLQAGMDAYVAKPIDPEELFAALEEQAAKLPKTTGAAQRGEDDDLDRYIEFVSSLEEEGPAGS
ncbi:MAG: response regulator, partial [Candidatus Krumholzibacteriota bacterium]|nr:response regulator [Candidatus Krumholzibacteriota bacterium]